MECDRTLYYTTNTTASPLFMIYFHIHVDHKRWRSIWWFRMFRNSQCIFCLATIRFMKDMCSRYGCCHRKCIARHNNSFSGMSGRPHRIRWSNMICACGCLCPAIVTQVSWGTTLRFLFLLTNVGCVSSWAPPRPRCWCLDSWSRRDWIDTTLPKFLSFRQSADINYRNTLSQIWVMYQSVPTFTVSWFL